MNYETVVGLEIHIQAKTKSKMFSSVSADYWNKPPNTNVDPVTLGLPGALPVPNKKAIEHCISLSLALNCEISRETKFDRKNYFYPDLPKGYQISQYDLPIGYEGHLDFRVNGEDHKINITRVHMEEDTGKSIHKGNTTLVDLNKAGVPLIEVVTEPEFTTGDQIDAFAKRLRELVRYLGVSDGDMEKGQMRYELNISLRPGGQKELPDYKVEVKNIGSISLLQKVLKFEQERQAEILDRGETPVQETRGAKTGAGKTFSQRIKENADDYRYFPEPDIPPLEFDDNYIEELRAQLPKLPGQLEREYIELGLNDEITSALISDQGRAETFELWRENQPQEVQTQLAKAITGEISAQQTEAKLDWAELREQISGELVALVANSLISKDINSSSYSKLLAQIVCGKITTEKQLTAEIKSLKADADVDLTSLAKEVVAAEPGAKERFAKNPKVVMFFVGQIMKQTRGAANPDEARAAVEEVLQSL